MTFDIEVSLLKRQNNANVLTASLKSCQEKLPSTYSKTSADKVVEQTVNWSGFIQDTSENGGLRSCASNTLKVHFGVGPTAPRKILQDSKILGRASTLRQRVKILHSLADGPGCLAENIHWHSYPNNTREETLDEYRDKLQSEMTYWRRFLRAVCRASEPAELQFTCVTPHVPSCDRTK